MYQSTAGTFRLFRVAGIDVYVHWTWLFIILLDVQFRADAYHSLFWVVAELLALVGLVLLHEFGHALACRLVGGIVHRIVLWPLTGAALVNPPPQPDRWLWTAAAGPLVNLFLVPLTVGPALVAAVLGWKQLLPDVYLFLTTIAILNLLMLVFNLLPIYPMDGGQILMALLWFRVGRPNSLMAVSILGMIGGGCILVLALAARELVLAVIAVFIFLQTLMGFQRSRYLARLLSGPRHLEAACPVCGVCPLVGDFWRCGACGTSFDTIEQRGSCPECGKIDEQTRCPECYHLTPLSAWLPPADQPDDEHVAPTGSRDAFPF
jgi:Zn-dependent protease